LSEYNGKDIETARFLDCCTEVFSILDYFGSTAFMPVKIDVHGNINKIRTKYTTDPKKYQYLQGIVQSEINEKTTNVKNSATDALMWLRRAIWFLQEFMREFTLRFNPDIGECVNGAYSNTLKQYHNWVVRSIFSLAVRSVPTKEDFLKTLAINQQDFLDNKKAFEKQVCFNN
jgi:pleckstrin family protein A (phosphoinositide binding specific) protein 8